ncbi:MAG: enoyl-CoA hydratase [Candidatus Lindowbacteria bacterium]|nr:enoyl-CoA hydratase [Candidatus Lindowbacteria bacterium]
MGWDNILLEKRNHIATITLNRPEKLNAFGGLMRQEIVQALDNVASDLETRVVIITGAGEAFCVGGDVMEFMDGSVKGLLKQTPSERHAMSKAVLAINAMEKPVIASVNGVAAGGGCNLALACDIRIASEKARFGQVFTRRGIHPDWGGIYFLPRLVGYAKAAELIFTGDVIDAKEAFKIGLVNRLVPHEELPSATRELAERIARNAPIPISFAKRGLQNFYKWDLAHAVDYEAYVLEVVMKTEDITEGFTAFVEKRDPVFKGR